MCVVMAIRVELDMALFLVRRAQRTDPDHARLAEEK